MYADIADIDANVDDVVADVGSRFGQSFCYEMTGDGWKHPAKGWPPVAGLDLVAHSLRAC